MLILIHVDSRQWNFAGEILKVMIAFVCHPVPPPSFPLSGFRRQPRNVSTFPGIVVPGPKRT